jgi:hypothetical protein
MTAGKPASLTSIICQYNQVLGGALNVFVALSDITPENAILWVAPRSHRLGTVASKDSERYGKGHREAAVEPEMGVPSLR